MDDDDDDDIDKLAPAIRIKRDADLDPADNDFAREIENLTGISYPPKDSDTWQELLTLADFSEGTIRQFLQHVDPMRYGKGTVPKGYGSVRARRTEDGTFVAIQTSTFHKQLLAGLRRTCETICLPNSAWARLWKVNVTTVRRWAKQFGMRGSRGESKFSVRILDARVLKHP